MTVHPMLAVIPCRGGSKGLPSKNIRVLAGLPLIGHSIRFAAFCPEITRYIVSTDSEEIRSVARDLGAEVPFLRPAELARDSTPMWPVLQHALAEMESREHCFYNSVLLLSPTSPGRLPEDVTEATRLLEQDDCAAGVVAVSEPAFNPRWTCIDKAKDGYMRQSFPNGEQYERRQDVPPIYRINGMLYLWRRDHVANSEKPGYFERPHRLLNIPDVRAIDIDTAADFHLAELKLRDGLIRLPWLSRYFLDENTELEATHE